MDYTKTQKNVRLLTLGALIASLYVTLTWLSALPGLSSGVIQLRLSEILTILPAMLAPALAPAAISGLFLGCLLANTLTGALFWDIVLGSLATLIGAIGTYHMRERPYLAWIAPVLSNAAIVPFILQTLYGATQLYPVLFISVAIGESLSAGVGGMIVYKYLSPRIKDIK